MPKPMDILIFCQQMIQTHVDLKKKPWVIISRVNTLCLLYADERSEDAMENCISSGFQSWPLVPRFQK